MNVLARSAKVHERIDASEPHGALAFQPPERNRDAQVEHDEDGQGDPTDRHVAEHVAGCPEVWERREVVWIGEAKRSEEKRKGKGGDGVG